jgi:Spy/CpxP family protein refolding chaperone
MSRKWIAAIVFASVILATAGFASARYARGERDFAGMSLLRELGLAKLQARLNLSAEQTQQIKEIGRSERTKRLDQFGSGAENRQALLKAIFSDNPNQTEIQKRVQALQEQHAKMLQDVVSTGLQVNKVFTPEQRVELQRVIEENSQVRAKMRDRAMQRRQQQPQAETQP